MNRPSLTHLFLRLFYQLARLLFAVLLFSILIIAVPVLAVLFQP